MKTIKAIITIKRFRFFNYSLSTVGTLLLVCAFLFGCTDKDLDDHGSNDSKRGMIFEVTDIQDMADTRAGTYSESDAPVGIVCEGDAGIEACLVETTVDGVCPVQRDSRTRTALKTAIDADFSAFACKNGSSKPDFFFNEKVHSNGTMYSPKSWTEDAASLKFYALYPYPDASHGMTLCDVSHTGAPYVDFVVNSSIPSQTDLMAATTADMPHPAGSVHIVPLTFKHATTAIKFAVGDDLSWAKIITKVELVGIYGSGRYDLGTGTWSDHGNATTFTLDGLNVSTSQNPNVELTGGNNTFLMVPQTLPSGAKAVITFSDGTQISAKLAGKTWAPGTTKTYKISNPSTSNWDYVLTVSSPVTAAHDATKTGNYTVTSYRKAPDNTLQPVAWEVVGYDANDDGTFNMSERPSWLTNLSLTQGTGGTSAQTGNATLHNPGEHTNDLPGALNTVLREAPERGTATSPHDLSLYEDVSGNYIGRTTANCYIVSSPGYYSLPLVYGNAIVNNVDNPKSYRTTTTHWAIQSNLTDHLDAKITSPYIGSKYTATQAKLVWQDEPGLVDNLSISGTGQDAMLRFRVQRSKIRQGNAVVAAVDASNTVLWSWHLWIAPYDVTRPVTVTNLDGKQFDFTREKLGFKCTSGEGHLFRSHHVLVKIRQKLGKRSLQEAIITIGQNGTVYGDGQGYPTQYQWGNKAPLPGIETGVEGPMLKWNFNVSTQAKFVKDVIQNPGYAYWRLNGKIWKDNFWNMNAVPNCPDYQEGTIEKTVYDPCPRGYHVASTDAYSRFTNKLNPSIEQSFPGSCENKWYPGLKFYTNSSKNETLFYPISIRLSKIGFHMHALTFYWTTRRTARTQSTQQFILGSHLEFGSQSLPLGVFVQQGMIKYNSGIGNVGCENRYPVQPIRER